YLARRTMAPLLDVLEEMDMLTRLHRDGLLSDDEYARKRTLVLERFERPRKRAPGAPVPPEGAVGRPRRRRRLFDRSVAPALPVPPVSAVRRPHRSACR